MRSHWARDWGFIGSNLTSMDHAFLLTQTAHIYTLACYEEGAGEVPLLQECFQSCTNLTILCLFLN